MFLVRLVAVVPERLVATAPKWPDWMTDRWIPLEPASSEGRRRAEETPAGRRRTAAEAFGRTRDPRSPAHRGHRT